MGTAENLSATRAGLVSSCRPETPIGRVYATNASNYEAHAGEQRITRVGDHLGRTQCETTTGLNPGAQPFTAPPVTTQHINEC